MRDSTTEVPIACFSSGGRWSPGENRPMHATRDGEKSLCGVQGIEIHRDPEPVPFLLMRQRCKRCERSLR